MENIEEKRQRLRFVNICRHFSLVVHHKWLVFVHCVKCGIPFRGVVHDMSKFSPEEFFESARYYQGNRSPIGICRRYTGMSRAWLHHKGRNKHHIEYWNDDDCKIPPVMPYKYAVECICDKLAATKAYNGKSYEPHKALEHWQRYGNKVKTNPLNLDFVEHVFIDLNEHGERYILNKKYMKCAYREVVLKRLNLPSDNSSENAE